MNDNIASLDAGMLVCGACKTENPDGSRFCQDCGQSLDGSKPKSGTKKRSKLGNLSANAHLKSIRTARITLIVVGVLTLIGGGVIHAGFLSQLESIQRNPQMVIDQAAVNQFRLIIYTIYGIGLVFFALNFWAKKNPFAATLTALIIYVSAWLIDIAADPTMIAKGLLIKLLIIAILVKGVKAGLAYRDMQERGSAR